MAQAAGRVRKWTPHCATRNLGRFTCEPAHRRLRLHAARRTHRAPSRRAPRRLAHDGAAPRGAAHRAPACSRTSRRFLREGDLVVLNDTRVIPARAFSDDGRIELLFLEAMPGRPHTWKCLVKPGRKMRLGALVHVGGVAGVVRGIEPEGERIIEFLGAGRPRAAGELPLPPYFERDVRSRRHRALPDRLRPRTRRRRRADRGTALHAGNPRANPARFRHAARRRRHLPLRAGGRSRASTACTPSASRISEETAAACNAAHAHHRRRHHDRARARIASAARCARAAGSTDIFIHPPYQPRAVDALLTNFHLPKSTLLMLV